MVLQGVRVVEMKSVQVWDLPVRLCHWLLVVAVVGAVVTVKLGSGWMQWHERFGLMVVALLSFRLVWGLVGTTHARFSSFVRGPATIRRYLRGQWHGLGHNPLGGWSVLALIGLFGFQAGTGLFATDDIAFNGPLYTAVSSDWSERLSSWHRMTEWGLYGLVALHVLAIIFYRVVRRDNLVLPMITGRKTVSDEGLAAEEPRGGGINAFLFAVAVAAGVVWIATGGLLPPPPPPPQDLGW